MDIFDRIFADFAAWLHLPWVTTLETFWIVFGTGTLLVLMATICVHRRRSGVAILCVIFSIITFYVSSAFLGPREFAEGRVADKVDDLIKVLPAEKVLRLAHAIGDETNSVVFVEIVDKVGSKGQSYFYCGRALTVPPRGTEGFKIVDGKFVALQIPTRHFLSQN